MEINISINQALIMIGELYAKNRLLVDELETQAMHLDEIRREREELRIEIASLRELENEEPEEDDVERAVLVHHVTD